MKNKILFFSASVTIIALFIPKLVFAETVKLKSGRTIEGRVLEKTDKHLKIDFYGVALTYYLEDIESIEGERTTDTSTPAVPTSILAQDKSPAQIFDETAPAIVVITAQLPNGTSQGSGFIVDSNGTIVTNFHVVAGAEEITVKLKDGRTFPVTGIIEYNPIRDVCALKIDVSGLPIVLLGNSDSLKPGQKIFVIGAPLGLEYSITDGLFSGKREEFGQKSLQFSAPISPGNSGGPLFDTAGRVIGITTFIITGGQNLNFAVPINEAKGFTRTSVKMSMDKFSKTISKAYPLYLAAHNEVYANNVEIAIEHFKEAIANDENFAEAYEDLGVLYARIGRVDESIVMLQKSVALKPNDAMTYVNLGASYSAKGMEDEAQRQYNKALFLDPNNGMAYLNLGAIYYRKGMFEEAITANQKAIVADNNFAAMAYAYIGDIYDVKKQFQDAIFSYKKAIAIDYNTSHAHGGLGAVYAKKGMIEEALKELQTAIAMDPNNADAHGNLALIYYDLKDYEAAVKHCDLTLKLGGKVHPQFLEALKPYRKSTTLSYQNADANVQSLFTEALTREKAGDSQGAYRLLKSALSLCSDKNSQFKTILMHEALRVCAYLMATTAQNKQYADSFAYAQEHIDLIEKAGGIETFINDVKRYSILTPEQEKQMDKIIEYNYAVGYLHAGIGYVIRGNLLEAQKCLDKIKKLAPKDADQLDLTIRQRPSSYEALP